MAVLDGHITQYGQGNHDLPDNWATIDGFVQDDYLVIKGQLGETTIHGEPTRTLPVEVPSRLTTGVITGHYVDDYYNRIHVVPAEIVTTVEDEETFYVWNAFSAGKTVVVDEPAVGSSFSITEFGRVDFRDVDDEVAYDHPINIDDAYLGFEERFHTVSIDGEVALDDQGIWTFTFDGEDPQSCTVSIAPLGLIVHWLFEVDTHKWSTKNHTWLSEAYLPRVVPESFRGVTLRYDLGGNLIAPSDLSFELVNEENVLPSELEGEFITVKMILDTVEARRWVFRIDRAVEYYGKIQVKCVDFLQGFLEGDWPNTPSPREVWLSDDAEPTDDYCIPVVLGTAYIPVRSVYITDDRYYVLGEEMAGVDEYTVYNVRSPRNWPSVTTWSGGTYTMSGAINSGWQLVQPIIAKSDPDEAEDSVGAWKSGDTFHDMLCQYTRDDTVGITNPARWIEYVLKDFGIPEEYIDDETFDAAAELFDAQAVEFNGGWWRKESREHILTNLLAQVDAYIVCTDKVELRQFSATPQETFDNVLVQSFRPAPITKATSDGGRVHWPEGTSKPQDILSGKAIVPTASGGTTTKPSSEILEARFLNGQAVAAQKAGILRAQKRYAQKNRVNFGVVLSDVTYKRSLSPGQVVTVNNTLYGGTSNIIITELGVQKDLRISIAGVELSTLEDWSLIAASDKAITQDDTQGFSIGTTDYQGNIGGGEYRELRFNANTSLTTAPTIETSHREGGDGLGWTEAPPVIESGEVIWMTIAHVKVDDTLDGLWSTPTRFSGEKGDSFQIDASGESAERSDHNHEPRGFVFLDTDIGKIYIKSSDTDGDYWSGPFDFVGDDAQTIRLETESHVFHVDDDGNAAPSYIDMFHRPQNISGAVTWDTDPPVTLDAIDGGRRLTFANMGANDKVKITTSIGGLSDTVTIVKVVDGSETYAVFLTNEAHTYPADKDGAVSSGLFGTSGPGNCEVRVFRGAQQFSCSSAEIGNPTDNGKYQISDISIVGTMTYVTANAFVDGNTEFRFRPETMGSDQVKVRLTVTARHNNQNTSFVKEISYAKSRAGTDGNPGDSGEHAVFFELSNPAHVIPASGDGVVIAGGHVGSGTTIHLYEGNTLLDYDGSGTNNGTWKTSANGTNITPGSPTATGSSPNRYVTYSDASNITDDKGNIAFTITGKRANGDAINIVVNQAFSKVKYGSRAGGIFTFEVAEADYLSVIEAGYWVSDPYSDDVTSKNVAQQVINESQDGYIRPNDRITITDNANDRAGTRVYIGPGTDLYNEASASDFSSLVVEMFDGSVIVNGTLSADALTANTTLTNNLVVGSTITINTSGALFSEGKTGYASTTAGYWLGHDGDYHKLNIGNNTNHIKWTGLGLDIKGAVTITSGEGIAELSDAGDLATQNRNNLDYTDGADVTNDNTANDTDNVSGVAAATVKDNAAAGSSHAGLKSSHNWQFDGVFSKHDYRHIKWTAGTLRFSDGSTVSIGAGTSGTFWSVNVPYYIYYPGTGTTLSTHGTASEAVGNNKVLIAVGMRGAAASDDPVWQVFGGAGGIMLAGGNIAAKTVTADQIAANTITAGELSSSLIYTGYIADHVSDPTLEIDFNTATITVNSADGLVVESDGGMHVKGGGDITIDHVGGSSGKLIFAEDDGNRNFIFDSIYSEGRSWLRIHPDSEAATNLSIFNFDGIALTSADSVKITSADSVKLAISGEQRGSLTLYKSVTDFAALHDANMSIAGKLGIGRNTPGEDTPDNGLYVTGDTILEGDLLSPDGLCIVSDSACSTNDDYAAVIASTNSDATGHTSAVIASIVSQATASRTVTVASRRTINNTVDSLALGYAGSGDASTANRKIHLFGETGNVHIAGSLTQSANFSDFVEFFENGEDKEIPVGTIITLDGDKTKIAGDGDPVDGVVSHTGGIRLNDTPFCWQGRYERDRFGRGLYEAIPDPDYEEEIPDPDYEQYIKNPDYTEDTKQEEDEKGVVEEYIRNPEERKMVKNPEPQQMVQAKKESPEWDITKEQTPRSQRPDEWTPVGLVGQVYVRVDETVKANSRVKPSANGVGTTTKERTGLRCMKITQEFDSKEGFAVAKCVINVSV